MCKRVIDISHRRLVQLLGRIERRGLAGITVSRGMISRHYGVPLEDLTPAQAEDAFKQLVDCFPTMLDNPLLIDRVPLWPADCLPPKDAKVPAKAPGKSKKASPAPANANTDRANFRLHVYDNASMDITTPITAAEARAILKILKVSP